VSTFEENAQPVVSDISVTTLNASIQKMRLEHFIVYLFLVWRLRLRRTWRWKALWWHRVGRPWPLLTAERAPLRVSCREPRNRPSHYLLRWNTSPAVTASNARPNGCPRRA